MKRELTCFCGNTIETDFPEEIDISKRPETLEEIINGGFMSVTCDSCGKILKPEFRSRIYDSSGAVDIMFFPELERTRYLAGKTESNAERVAIGFPELREKILAVKHKLDDRAVEILKFFLLEKVENPGEVSVTLVDIEQRDEEEKSLVFHIRGLKEEEIGVPKVPIDLYNRIIDSLEERLSGEPFNSFATGQYVSINKISIEDEES